MKKYLALALAVVFALFRTRGNNGSPEDGRCGSRRGRCG